MFGQTLTIARNTFVESMRQPIAVILVVISGILQVFNLMLSAYSMGYTEETEVSGDDKLLLDMGLATVFAAATLLAAFVATNVLAREIQNKTALTVVSKPIGKPLFILGKYLGVAGAMTVTTAIMVVFFLFAVRHGVMSTARDDVHMPVVTFSLLAVGLSLGLGVWCNYFYDRPFGSTALYAMLPLSVIGYGASLMLDEQWSVVSVLESARPQITLASACVLMALLVLSAVAIAVSTRLGQVMTVVVCAGAFVGGLMSNHFLGRSAFRNEPVAQIEAVDAGFPPEDLGDAGGGVALTLNRIPAEGLPAGTAVYFGPNPTGVGLAVPAHPGLPLGVAVPDPDAARRWAGEAALVVSSADDASRVYEVRNIGGLAIARGPSAGDFVFTTPTSVSPAALAAWSVVPNLQFFWLVDAITQGNPIPTRYVALAGGYTATQVVALLALAVLLFQRRDVG